MEAIARSATGLVQSLTDSTSPSSTWSAPVAKPAIRAPRNWDEARALKAWAESPQPAPERIAPDEFARTLRFMNATLPSRNQDFESGAMRASAYASIIGHHTPEAIAYMARRACETLDWFPTPKQCLEILATYPKPVPETETALMLCHRFAQDQFEDFIRMLEARTATAETVASVPERWRRIAMERGYLRLMPDGVFVIRECVA